MSYILEDENKIQRINFGKNVKQQINLNLLASTSGISRQTYLESQYRITGQKASM
jgi:hypothetical protein